MTPEEDIQNLTFLLRDGNIPSLVNYLNNEVDTDKRYSFSMLDYQDKYSFLKTAIIDQLASLTDYTYKITHIPGLSKALWHIEMLDEDTFFPRWEYMCFTMQGFTVGQWMDPFLWNIEDIHKDRPSKFTIWPFAEISWAYSNYVGYYMGHNHVLYESLQQGSIPYKLLREVRRTLPRGIIFNTNLKAPDYNENKMEYLFWYSTQYFALEP
jgi:hypothetical protein